MGGGGVLAMLKGEGGTTSFEVALTRELGVLVILRGAKCFHHLKKKGGGGATSFTLS